MPKTLSLKALRSLNPCFLRSGSSMRKLPETSRQKLRFSLPTAFIGAAARCLVVAAAAIAVALAVAIAAALAVAVVPEERAEL